MIGKDQETKRISFGEIAKELNQGLERADPARVAGLQQLGRMRAIKGAIMVREHARLSQKLGTSHTRVTALKQKRETNGELERDLALGISRAQTPAIQPDANAWILHGHVRNQARIGLPNLTVALYESQWIEDLGYACTDAKGYFRLTARPQAVDVNQSPAAVRAAGETTAAGRAVYIHVTDAQGATLYVDAKALTPKPGDVVYREIVLDGDVCECAPPGGKQPTPNSKPAQSKEGRYLGDRGVHKVHDLKNAKPDCRIEEIKDREYFTSQKGAVAAGYDFCAYCFGKEKSKR